MVIIRFISIFRFARHRPPNGSKCDSQTFHTNQLDGRFGIDAKPVYVVDLLSTVQYALRVHSKQLTFRGMLGQYASCPINIKLYFRCSACSRAHFEENVHNLLIHKSHSSNAHTFPISGAAIRVSNAANRILWTVREKCSAFSNWLADSNMAIGWAACVLIAARKMPICVPWLPIIWLWFQNSLAGFFRRAKE